MIESLLYTRLSSFSGLLALVGNRIYPQVLPPNVVFPALTYQIISNPEQEHCMVADVGITNPRLQISAWGDSYDAVTAIIYQVKAACQRWSTTGIQDTLIAAEPYDLPYDAAALKYGKALDIRPFVED